MKYRNIFAFVLSICLLLSVAPFAAAEESGDFDYEISNGEATITGYYGPGGDIAIPSELGGAPVTVIGEYTFVYCTDLTNIVIPDSVTSIDERVFVNCRSLTSITVPACMVDKLRYVLWGC